ncbi:MULTISPECIES: pyrroline-5-carboxylate reductase [Oceanobacillus]|uniref:Pyrroline-5-carboxylate reductase n=1 Tax=Oceanobacillus kimchii TaxID=746691 RepID=A0ABQ5TF71_9BACI|nr:MULTISPECIES: pyrroline-5-carboxylate reductase [Oceanobacillus]MBT2599883.1 pyrroline-5-carboxylate reductase [Oceanobacillus sp. ISL-74]MBT2652667.1 pyrroline-5-carboxylate reductase [Oceanobacillus sp. ISL-73]MCT1577210.1 pyrroline-5-carboxylate reductase [Oceanobacillus kimchii]MCT2135280.1 pyrroline-5-carboxylate reductase [Oceanobacillus kimchii]OEH56547.1 pyrroline-5-carboxylate reductase [Oceanobacillus sp. E9]
MNQKIAFMGAGSLAEAIISGITKAKIVPNENILVTNKSDKNRLKRMEEGYAIQGNTNKKEVITQADIIILAMKPKDAATSLSFMKEYIRSNQMVISVIAGLTTERMESILEKEIPVIRTMPNTSALIGHSATAIAKGTYVTNEQLAIAEQLFQTVGMTTIIEEEDMHTVTAIAGSGPAFFYYMVEAMEQAATEAGLDSELASQLLAQTVIGAGKMLELSGDPKTLRKNITSPGGTTEAGVKQLMSEDFAAIVQSCVQRARERSMELAAKS